MDFTEWAYSNSSNSFRGPANPVDGELLLFPVRHYILLNIQDEGE